jgi:hypothetical protein
MKISLLIKQLISCLFIILILFFNDTAINASSLSVGTKVIYPGGADQPPKEKDTGVSLNAEIESGGKTFDANNEPDPEQIYIENDYESTIEILKDFDSPECRAYVAIAMYNLGQEEKAKKIAKSLLEQKFLKTSTIQTLIEELELEEELKEDYQN